MNTENTILTAISTVGFPIVVTFYLLTRFQRSMDNFTEQLASLVKELQRRPWYHKSSSQFAGSFYVENSA